MADIKCAYDNRHTVVSTYATVLHEGYLIRVPVEICVDKECVAKRAGTITLNATGPNPGSRPRPLVESNVHINT